MVNKMIFKILLSIVQIATAIATPSLPPLLQQLQGVMKQAQFLQQMPNPAEELQMHQIPEVETQQWPHMHEMPEIVQKQMHPMPIYQRVNSVHPAPALQMQGTMHQQMLALQEQMFAHQKFQALQRMGLIPSSTAMNASPILVLFSDTVPDNELEVRRTDFDTKNVKSPKPDIEDDDSVVIEAEATEETNIKRNQDHQRMRAVLLMPNTRGFIGDIISSIPFLPLEINVPDTISWIYNGISGIISGIGQILPFRPQTQNSETQDQGNVKSIWKQMQTEKQMPVVMIPLGQWPIFPQG